MAEQQAPEAVPAENKSRWYSRWNLAIPISGMFHSPVDSFIDAFGGDRMAIIRLNHHDSSPSTTDQRRYDEVYQTSRFRSANPYRNCQRRLDPSRPLRQDDPDCSGLSHFQNLSLSALLGCQAPFGRSLSRSPTPRRAP